MSDQNKPSTEPKILNDVDDAAEAILSAWEERPEEDHSDKTEEAADTEADETSQGELFDDEDDESVEVDIDEDEDLDEPDNDNNDHEVEDEEQKNVLTDDAKVEIVVDGQNIEVSVSDLKRLYGQEASLTRKSQDVSQQRKIAEANIEKTHVVLQKMIEKAQEQYRPYEEVDMLVASKTMDAADFAQLRKEAQAAETNLRFLQTEADNFYNDLKSQQQQTLQQQAVEAVKHLQVEIPDWSNSLYNDIRAYAVSQGLPQDQVDQYVDPNVIILLNKARLYDAGKKVAVVKKKRSNQKVLRNRKAPQSSKDKLIAKKADVTKRLRSSNDLDDIADAILDRWVE